jgi:hypothetical protein
MGDALVRLRFPPASYLQEVESTVQAFTIAAYLQEISDTVQALGAEAIHRIRAISLLAL